MVTADSLIVIDSWHRRRRRRCTIVPGTETLMHGENRNLDFSNSFYEFNKIL